MGSKMFLKNYAYEVGTVETVISVSSDEGDEFYYPDYEHKQVSRRLESNNGKA